MSGGAVGGHAGASDGPAQDGRGGAASAAAQRGGERAAAAPGSAAPVIGPADDEQVGAVGERLLGRGDAGLVLRRRRRRGARPGVMSTMSGPTSARTAATSCGEQTSARAPAPTDEHRQPPHGVERRPGQPDGVERRVVGARSAR